MLTTLIKKLTGEKKTSLMLQTETLHEEISKTKRALDSAYSNFENVVDPDLIDCYIYEVNAVQKRYVFLLKKAEELRALNVKNICD